MEQQEYQGHKQGIHCYGKDPAEGCGKVKPVSGYEIPDKKAKVGQAKDLPLSVVGLLHPNAILGVKKRYKSKE